MTAPLSAGDELHLRAVIAAAATLGKDGRYPFTARLVDTVGTVLTTADNEVALTGDPTAHAELVLVRRASARHSRADFAQCTLYAAAEPCAMCASAIIWCGIGRVVYGLSATRVREHDPLPPDMREPGVSGRAVLDSTPDGPIVSGPHLEAEAMAALFPLSSTTHSSP